MNRIFLWFLHRERLVKRLISLAVDFIMLMFACFCAIALRLGSTDSVVDIYWQVILLAPLSAIPVMIPTGMYRAIIRYVGYRAIWTVVKAVSLGVLVWALCIVMFNLSVPRSAIIIYWMAALVGVSGTRLFGRWLFRQFTPIGRNYKNRHASRALIYGAGAYGQQVATALHNGQEVSPVAFIDDNPSMHGSEISGLRIFSFDDIEGLIKRYDVDTILLCIQDLSVTSKRQIVRGLEKYSVSVKQIPSFSATATGLIRNSDIADVEVSDLLGRDCVESNKVLLSSCIRDKTVLVTGAGGSIGSELCRQIVLQKPARLILFELNEYGLYKLEQELQFFIEQHDLMIDLLPFLGNVQNAKYLEKVLCRYRVNTIYHAAAYKHVPMVEYNVVAGIENNLMGTLSVAEAAVKTGVENFVLISTDKAVRPTNVMGASKRLSEMVLQAISDRESTEADATRFTMVRFGNVLGSSGSVIPRFKKQIQSGGPVTVTHPDITRYFMTIPEAASLVIQAGSMGHSGDVYVLDMGEPIKIIDLAKEMIALAGQTLRDEDNPDGDIEIIYTGLRPGEKLFEELLISGNILGTEHPMIMRSSEEFIVWSELEHELEALKLQLADGNYDGLRNKLMQLVSGYSPQVDIQDLLYQPHCTSK